MGWWWRSCRCWPGGLRVSLITGSELMGSKAMYRLIGNPGWVMPLLLAAAISSANGQTPATEMFSTDWSRGIDRRLLLQEATPDAIRVVRLARADMDTAVVFTISRNTDYQRG